jgi:hypothetical protein
MASELQNVDVKKQNFKLFIQNATSYFNKLKQLYTGETATLDNFIEALQTFKNDAQDNGYIVYLCETMIEANAIGNSLTAVETKIPGTFAFSSALALKATIGEYRAVLTLQDAQPPLYAYLTKLAEEASAVVKQLLIVYIDDDFKDSSLKPLANRVRALKEDLSAIALALHNPDFADAQALLHTQAKALNKFTSDIDRIKKALGTAAEVITTTLSVLAFLAKFFL